jgi:predicted transcriptional regulator
MEYLHIKGMMMNIGELCNRETIIVLKEENIVEAARLMRHFHVGDLIVVSKNGDDNTPVGIVTDRDIVMEVVANNADPQTVKVAEIMSQELMTGSEEEGIHEIIERMRIHGIRRLPIVDKEGCLAGIVSVDDILEFLGEEVDALIGLFYKERRSETDKMG